MDKEDAKPEEEKPSKLSTEDIERLMRQAVPGAMELDRQLRRVFELTPEQRYRVLR